MTEVRQRHARASWRLIADQVSLAASTRPRPKVAGYHHNNELQYLHEHSPTTTLKFACNQEAGHCMKSSSEAQMFTNQHHKQATSVALPRPRRTRRDASERVQIFQQPSRWCRTQLSPPTTPTLVVPLLLLLVAIINCAHGHQLEAVHLHQSVSHNPWVPIVGLPTMTNGQKLAVDSKEDKVLLQQAVGTRNSNHQADDNLAQSTQLVEAQATDLAPFVELAGVDSSEADMLAADSKKKKKMMKKKKKMEKKHKEWKKGKKHKKKKYEMKKKKGGSMKKKKGKKMKKKWGMEKKGHKKKGNFKKKKWGHKKKMKKGHKKGKKGHKMLKDKGHKKKGFKKVYHKEEWGKKKKWHDIKREKKWNTKQKKWKKKWHQEKGKKYKGKHMKKYHKKNKHGKKYKKEKKSKYKKHKGEKFKKGHKKKKEEYSKKKEGGKKKKMKKEMKKMKKKKG